MRSAFRLPERLSLRTRLLVLLVALAVVGLAAADFASYRALHNYLYDRVDQQLESAVGPVAATLTEKAGEAEALGFGAGPEGAGPGAGGAGGSAARGAAGPAAGGPAPHGDLPGRRLRAAPRRPGEVVATHRLRILRRKGADAGSSRPTSRRPRSQSISPVTVGERGGGSEQFRAAAVGVGGRRLVAVVAVPLGDTNATLSHLALIELVVSAAILIALAAAAWWLVGLGLRPLRRMGEVAGQIAAGDLSRRVEPDDERTEVGRLGRSLNAMLAQIEAAFAERAAGERRLRASSPTPRTSCARRWRRSAATPSSTGSARRGSRPRWSGRWRGSRRSRRGWAGWSTTC